LQSRLSSRATLSRLLSPPVVSIVQRLRTVGPSTPFSCKASPGRSAPLKHYQYSGLPRGARAWVGPRWAQRSRLSVNIDHHGTCVPRRPPFRAGGPGNAVLWSTHTYVAMANDHSERMDLAPLHSYRLPYFTMPMAVFSLSLFVTVWILAGRDLTVARE
jgi:hypothetical protein